MIKKAILLAGGEGTRLRPFTLYTSKHLLPVFNKPMIVYPLTNLILLGVETVYLVINAVHRTQWEALIRSLDLSVDILLIEQERPDGIPQAISLCERYLDGDPFFLALGDNILLGSGLLNRFYSQICDNPEDSVIISYKVSNPKFFGVAELDDDGELIKIVEKPTDIVSNLAIVGLYKFNSDAPLLVRDLKKSARGEYEIADLINQYIAMQKCQMLACNEASDYWLDTGTIESITSAAIFLRELNLSGIKVIGNLTKD